MTWILKGIIRGYQYLGSMLLPRTCRFYPSCSAYALEAIQKYGIWGGATKAIARIIRCSPFSRGGYDPLK